jgi:hypothetical protein
MHEIKKRKLVLNRETLMPLQPSDLERAYGGQKKEQEHLGEKTLKSAGASGALSGVVSQPGISASASAAGAFIDRVSENVRVPCWAATTASLISRFMRK